MRAGSAGQGRPIGRPGRVALIGARIIRRATLRVSAPPLNLSARSLSLRHTARRTISVPPALVRQKPVVSHLHPELFVCVRGAFLSWLSRVLRPRFVGGSVPRRVSDVFDSPELARTIATCSLPRQGNPKGTRPHGEAGRPRAASRAPQPPKAAARRPRAPERTAKERRQLCQTHSAPKEAV